VGWTFTGTSGVQANGSIWSAPSAPGGTRTAFIQGTGNISQTVSMSAGNHTLSFQVARRPCCAPPNIQPIKVMIDGVQIGALVTPSASGFKSVSIPFTVTTSGAHTITFAGTNPADKTMFIDQVMLQ
jgi:hypothetical protein